MSSFVFLCLWEQVMFLTLTTESSRSPSLSGQLVAMGVKDCRLERNKKKERG